MCCRYWTDIDTQLRRVAYERRIRVRLLISCWDNTSPIMFPFLRSLASLRENEKLDVQVVSVRLSVQSKGVVRWNITLFRLRSNV